MTLIEYNPGHMITTNRHTGGWRRAARCVPNGNCVEINRERLDRVGVRDSKGPSAGPTLEFQASMWTRFLDQLKG